MISFKQFIKENEEKMTISDVQKTLESLGYTTKLVTKSRIAIVTDKRQAALNHVQEIYKTVRPRVLKDAESLRISSLGIIQVGNVQIIAKPASKNVLKAEQEATESLIKIIKQAVEQEGKPITVMIGNYKIENVVSAGSDQIRGDPKADIALLNDTNEEVGFISHKKEGGAKAFQQYAGISSSAGNTIYNSPIVKSFVKDLSKAVKNNSLTSGQSFWRYLSNDLEGKALAGYSVYGPKWNWGRPNSFSRDSVHCIGQGSPILTRNTNGTYKLTFSETIHTAKELDWVFAGSYKIILAVTYRSGRKVQSTNITISNSRGGTYPHDFVTGRRSIEI